MAKDLIIGCFVEMGHQMTSHSDAAIDQFSTFHHHGFPSRDGIPMIMAHSWRIRLPSMGLLDSRATSFQRPSGLLASQGLACFRRGPMRHGCLAWLRLPEAAPERDADRTRHTRSAHQHGLDHCGLSQFICGSIIFSNGNGSSGGGVAVLKPVRL